MSITTVTIVGYGDSDYGSLPYGAGVDGGVTGIQFDAVIADTEDAQGMQFEAVTNEQDPQGLEFFASNLGFICPGYGESDYGGLGYGVTACIASGAMQFDALIVDFENPQGMQFEATIDFENPQGLQFEATIDFQNAQGMQFLALIGSQDSEGMQFEATIDFQDAQGMQFEATIDAQDSEGMQFEATIQAEDAEGSR